MKPGNYVCIIKNAECVSVLGNTITHLQGNRIPYLKSSELNEIKQQLSD